MRRANSFVATGEIELMSTTVLPGARPLAMPRSPNSTASTSGVAGTMTKMMSARSATPRCDVNCVADVSETDGGILPSVCTNSWCPASMRWRHIGEPMMPRPMKPIFCACDVISVLHQGFAVQPQQRVLGSRGRRLVFATDPAFVADAVEVREEERVIDLARARFAAARVVGDLHVRDAVEVTCQPVGDLAFHALRVVDVVLQED